MDKGHQAIWEAWIKSVRSGDPPIPYEQLFAVCTLTLAASESLRSGKASEIQLEPHLTEVTSQQE
jgi:hypothetical protein